MKAKLFIFILASLFIYQNAYSSDSPMYTKDVNGDFDWLYSASAGDYRSGNYAQNPSTTIVHYNGRLVGESSSTMSVTCTFSDQGDLTTTQTLNVPPDHIVVCQGDVISMFIPGWRPYQVTLYARSCPSTHRVQITWVDEDNQNSWGDIFCNINQIL